MLPDRLPGVVGTLTDAVLAPDVVTEMVLAVVDAGALFANGRLAMLEDDNVTVAGVMATCDAGMTANKGMALTALWRLPRRKPRRRLFPAAAHCSAGMRGRSLMTLPQ